MASREALRASDADRERIAERLHSAATEGRIRVEELEQRLEAAFSARTYGELARIVSDLPGGAMVMRAPGRSVTPVRRAMLAALAVSVGIVLAVAAVFVITGVFAVWMLWLLVGWWFFGRRRHAHGARYMHAYGPWHRGRRRPGGFSV